MKKARIPALLLIVIFVSGVFFHASYDSFAEMKVFTPHPKTAYAKKFIALCENQTWYINEIERLLNLEQKSLNNVKGREDFNNIRSLGLTGKGIKGKIPRAIGELSNLESLFMSDNKLGENIPNELFSLQNLSNIDLSNNEYKINIPGGFGNMPSISKLILRGNQFKGSVPESITENTNITVLDISGNSLSGKIPEKLNNMTGLLYLAISDNPWEEGKLPVFSKLDKLKVLSMWKCNIKDEIKEELCEMKTLEVLDLAENKIYGKFPANFNKFVNMELFSVGKNRLTGTIPDVFSNVPKLKTIDLNGNKLRGQVPESLKTIKTAHLDNNYLTGENLNSIEKNEKNFCDNEINEQYYMKAREILLISKTENTNVYALLRNYDTIRNSHATEKMLLDPEDYDTEIINDPEGKVELTRNEEGIYLRAKKDIKSDENIFIEIKIRDNDGSDYSKVRMNITTFIPNPGSSDNPAVSPAKDDKEKIKVLHKAYIDGYPDKSFGGEKSVTREQIAKMVTVALDIDLPNKGNIIRESFSDVKKSRWSVQYVERTKELGWLKGYGNGKFGPENSITRAELAACLVRITEMKENEFEESGHLNDGKENMRFKDVAEGKWYTDYVLKASGMKLIKGYPDGNFKPENKVTRTEAVFMINRMLERKPHEEAELLKIKNPFKDLKIDYFAYLDIIEASVTHEYELLKQQGKEDK